MKRNPAKLLWGQEILDMSPKKRTLWIFGIILIFLCLICLELYIDRTMEYMTDSDISSELILADLLAKEGKALTSNWYYSSEIRLLNTNLIFAPLFRFFGNWHKIRLCGTIVLHLLLLLSSFLLCRSVRITRFFPIVGLMTILPFSTGYYEFVLEFPFYIPHIIITFLTLALAFQYSENNRSRKLNVFYLLAAFILSFLAGLGGPRLLLICYLSLFPAAFFPFIRGIFKTEKPAYADNRNRYMCFASLCLTAAVAGFILNVNVLSGLYHFQVHKISFIDFDSTRLLNALQEFLHVFGYITGETNIQSVLSNIIAVFIFFLSVIYAIQGIKKGLNGSSPYYYLSCFYIFSLCLYALLYAFTDMYYADRHSRFALPVIIPAAPVIALGIAHMKDYKESFRKTLLGLWCVSLLFSGMEVLRNRGIPEDKSDHQIIAEYLVQNDYHEGYATFWNANILTELSNGRIEMYTWGPAMDRAAGHVDSLFQWLQVVRHDTQRPTGKVFLLFQNDQIKPNMDPEIVSSQKLWKLRPERIILTQGNYTVYGYESYQAMISEIYDYDFIFSNQNWLINGEDHQGIRTLKNGGISFGPYIEFYKGQYRVTITGDGLLRADFSVTCHSGKDQIDINMISADDQKIVYEFCVPENVTEGETIIINTSEEDIMINTQQIDYSATVQ